MEIEQPGARAADPHAADRNGSQGVSYSRQGKQCPSLLIFLSCSQETTNRKYPQSDIFSPIWDINSRVGDNIANWGLGISESGKADSEIKSPIPD